MCGASHGAPRATGGRGVRLVRRAVAWPGCGSSGHLQQQLAAEAAEQVREAPVVQVAETQLPVAVLPPAEELALDRACRRVVVAAR